MRKKRTLTAYIPSKKKRETASGRVQSSVKQKREVRAYQVHVQGRWKRTTERQRQDTVRAKHFLEQAVTLQTIHSKVTPKKLAFNTERYRLNLFRTAVPFWGQAAWNLTGSSPKWDHSWLNPTKN